MGAARHHKYLLLPPKGDPMRKWALGLFCAWPVFYGLLALWLGADASWDLRNYHWYNPYAYLNNRDDFLPSQSQFFLNPWLDVPFYVAATHLPLKLVYFLFGVVQGLNFPLVFMLGYLTLIIRDTRRKTAACAALAALGCLSAIGISEIGCVFYDNVTSIGVLLSALLLAWRLDFLLKGDLTQAMAKAALFGLPIGLCVGLKMTCASFCVGECFALLVVSTVSRRGFLVTFGFGCGAVLGFIVTYGHWAWHLYSLYDSPTFPYFNRLFHAPLVPPVAIGDYFISGGMAKLLHPYMIVVDPYLANEIIWKDWRIPILYTLLIAAAGTFLLRPKKPDGGPLAESGPGRFLLWMGAASYFTWISFDAVYRYLLPLDMLAPLMIVICAGALPGDLRTRWQTAASALIVIVFTIHPGSWGRHHVWPEKVAALSGAPLPDKPDTLVLMAGLNAYAYLLPEFPPQLHFVRVESRAFSADDDMGIAKLMQAKAEDHKGPLKLFMPARHVADTEKLLRFLGLGIVPKSCKTLHDDFYEAHLDRPQEMNNAYPPDFSLCDLKLLPAKK
jgi:hypothetical protein